ncbi:MAG: TIGR00725 family protein [Candidatus Aminicenantes bacterium]|nr:TIGR00725 family protein [Candidatus Aminicenantes bacterium]
MKTQTGSEFALKKRIGLIGGSSPAVRHLQIAETMGRLIAENGFLLVNGGLKGVMEASARGAKAHGGWVIGILPGKSTQETNRFTDIAIPTGLGYLRNALVVLNSDVLVAINGAYGTLSEIAYTQVYGKKVFGIETWDIPGVIAVESPQAAMQQIIAYFEQLK